ncbi:hypothetical protein MYA_3605 [Burkholderia sp. KJ006]|nr:hypothetical protein MYA_3605 [Burkholderia sp. KJ006]
MWSRRRSGWARHAERSGSCWPCVRMRAGHTHGGCRAGFRCRAVRTRGCVGHRPVRQHVVIE